MVGIDPASDGLARAAPARRRRPPPTASTGSSRCTASTTSRSSSTPPRPRPTSPTPPRWRRTASGSIDLTPAAIGPYVVPAVNLDEHLDAAERQHGHLRRPGHHPDRRRLARVAPVPYAEIVASIASKSAGPGTRANIDEFTETTSAGHRAGRRRRARQGDHHPQPGRAAADHARHRASASSTPTADHDGDPRLGRGDGRRRGRATCPATASSRRSSSPRSPPTSRSHTLLADGDRPADPPGVGVPRGRGRRPLPARPTPATSTS